MGSVQVKTFSTLCIIPDLRLGSRCQKTDFIPTVYKTVNVMVSFLLLIIFAPSKSPALGFVNCLGSLTKANKTSPLIPLPLNNETIGRRSFGF